MANKIHDAFDCIQANPRLKETTKQYLANQRTDKALPYPAVQRPGNSTPYPAVQRPGRTMPVSRRPFQHLLATACIALFLVVGLSSYAWIQAPVSYVSIDVNPSIELALNRFDRVVSATAFNAQGEEILRQLSLNGKKYTDAIDLIVDTKAMGAYLTDESELVFTVASKSHHEELQTGVEKCSNHISHFTHSVSADIKLVSQAHENGLSIGKYYAWLQLVQYDDSITVDECRNMSMSRIHHLIGEHTQDETGGDCSGTTTDDSNTDTGHGCHHGTGGHGCE